MSIVELQVQGFLHTYAIARQIEICASLSESSVAKTADAYRSEQRSIAAQHAAEFQVRLNQD